MVATEDDIHQILYNLMENGIKYSGSMGFVHTTLKTVGDTVVISVEDNGIGIPNEDMEHIFERFYRVDKNRSQAVGGTGLGLSIVSDTVRRRGGSIRPAPAVRQRHRVHRGAAPYPARGGGRMKKRIFLLLLCLALLLTGCAASRRTPKQTFRIYGLSGAPGGDAISAVDVDWSERKKPHRAPAGPGGSGAAAGGVHRAGLPHAHPPGGDAAQLPAYRRHDPGGLLPGV